MFTFIQEKFKMRTNSPCLRLKTLFLLKSDTHNCNMADPENLFICMWHTMARILFHKMIPVPFSACLQIISVKHTVVRFCLFHLQWHWIKCITIAAPCYFAPTSASKHVNVMQSRLQKLSPVEMWQFCRSIRFGF